MSKLTDEQINQMWSDAHNDTSTTSLIHVLARAIESAACAERDARIVELDRELAEARNITNSQALEIFNDLEKFMDQIEEEDISDERLAGKSMQFILGRVAAIEAAHNIGEKK